MKTDLCDQVLINRFAVERLIKKGGVGEIYLGRDLCNDMQIVIKTSIIDDPSEEITEMFKREAHFQQLLNHPNVIPVYGYYFKDSRSFIVEKFIDGMSLEDIMIGRNYQPLTIKETLIILNSLTNVLNFIHNNGFAHCDIKPGNIMIDKNGQLFLCDFNLCRPIVGEMASRRFTFGGTPSYMAPEQYDFDGFITTSTDVYSLGGVIFELLTGRNVFTTSDSKKFSSNTYYLAFAHKNTCPPDPRKYNSRIPPAFSQIILRMLSKDPNDRYQNTLVLFQIICRALNIEENSIPSISNFQELINPTITGELKLKYFFKSFFKRILHF